jgi:deazaflavin-dependent oxidoreductase (nitroreductase family)
VSDDWKKWNERNQRIAAEFRANGGKVAGWETKPLLILTTTGAKSSLPREAPLCYVMDGDRYVLIASKGGSPTHPDWYHNLVANPIVKVEVGTETFSARASFPRGAERRRLYDAMAAVMPFFADYEQNTPQREIPVVLLERIAEEPTPVR